jgi:hypothetical protein
MTLILRTLHTIRAPFNGPRFDLLNRNLRLQIARHGDSINISHKITQSPRILQSMKKTKKTKKKEKRRGRDRDRGEFEEKERKDNLAKL